MDVLDSDYVRKVGKAAQRRLQLQEANKLLAGATQLEHWQEALAAFRAVVEVRHNLPWPARVGRIIIISSLP